MEAERRERKRGHGEGVDVERKDGNGERVGERGGSEGERRNDERVSRPRTIISWCMSGSPVVAFMAGVVHVRGYAS